MPPGFPAGPQYFGHPAVGPHPSQNRACAIHAHGSSRGHSLRSSRLCDAVLSPPTPRDWARTVCPHIARPRVASFPPAELPAFVGRMRRSDSLRAIGSAFLISVVGALSHPWKHPRGLPGCRVFTVSCVPWSPTPGKRARPGRPAAAPMLTSASLRASSFPTKLISGLNPFNLSAYGLHACGPTLKDRGYPLTSKDSLSGGCPALPERDSHPRENTTLPGRTVRSARCPRRIRCPSLFCRVGPCFNA